MSKFVTLISSASREDYPANVPHNFTVNLQSPLELEGEWEVGLDRINVPKYLLNINAKNNIFKVRSSKLTPSKVEYEYPTDPLSIIKLELNFNNMPKPGYITRRIYFRELANLLQQYNDQIFLLESNVITPKGKQTPSASSLQAEALTGSGSTDNEEPIQTVPSERIIVFDNSIAIEMERLSGKFPRTKYSIHFKKGWKLLYNLQNSYFQENIMPLRTILGLNYEDFLKRIGPAPIEVEEYDANVNYEFYVPPHTIYLIPPNFGYSDRSDAVVISGTDSLFVKNLTGNGFNVTEQIYSCIIPIGHYKDAPSLIGAMNKEIPNDAKTYLNFMVSEAGKFIINSRDKKHYTVSFPITTGLGDLLGLIVEDQQIALPKEASLEEQLAANEIPELGQLIELAPNGESDMYTGKYPIDISDSVTSLFIYCDLVTNQMVGDTRGNLLRVISTGNPDSLEYVFSNVIQYIKVERSQITSIEILLLDDAGEEIQFAIGKTNLTLHFRKVEKPIAGPITAPVSSSSYSPNKRKKGRQDVGRGFYA